MMVRSPKPTSRSRTWMIASRSRCAAWGRVSNISVPNGREEHGEEPIENDHHEDRLHDRGCDVAAQGLGRAFDGKAFDGGDDPDHERHEGRLDDADQEGVEADG